MQTTLAEADHYSTMPTVKMLSLGGEREIEREKKKVWIITCTKIWLFYRYYDVCCSFTHLRILRSAPKFNQFFIALPMSPL